MYKHSRSVYSRTPRLTLPLIKHRYYRKVEDCSRDLDALPEKLAHENAKERLSTLEDDFRQASSEEKERPVLDEIDRKNLLLDFAKLLSEPKLEFETAKQFQSRIGSDPLYMGVIKTEEADVRVLNILKEPTELILSIPVSSTISIDVEPVEAGKEYYIFGTHELFCSKRNDEVPMDFSPTSTRSAQRDLMAMLLRDARNNSLVASRPAISSSVTLRGTSNESLGDVVKCFDLSELVRDCNYPITSMPLADTPQKLAENGLVLRDYQKTTLQWLLDKESNPTGMGSSGELWTRMRGLGGGNDKSSCYYYCELTGSILRDIFDYQSDVDQKGELIDPSTWQSL